MHVNSKNQNLKRLFFKIKFNWVNLSLNFCEAVLMVPPKDGYFLMLWSQHVQNGVWILNSVPQPKAFNIQPSFHVVT